MAVRYRSEFRSYSGFFWTVDLKDTTYSGAINTFEIESISFNAETENDQIYDNIVFVNLDVNCLGIDDYWQDINTKDPNFFDVELRADHLLFRGKLVYEAGGKTLSGQNIYALNFTDIKINQIINKDSYKRIGGFNRILLDRISIVDYFDDKIGVGDYQFLSTIENITNSDDFYFEQSTFENKGFSVNALEGLKRILKSFQLHYHTNYFFNEEVRINDFIHSDNELEVYESMFLTDMVESYDEDFKRIIVSNKLDLINQFMTTLDIREMTEFSGQYVSSMRYEREWIDPKNTLAIQAKFEKVGNDFVQQSSNEPYNVDPNLAIGNYQPITLVKSESDEFYYCYETQEIKLITNTSRRLFYTKVRLKVETSRFDSYDFESTIVFLFQYSNSYYYYDTVAGQMTSLNTLDFSLALHNAFFGNPIIHNFDTGAYEESLSLDTVNSTWLLWEGDVRVYVFNKSKNSTSISEPLTIENVSIAPESFSKDFDFTIEKSRVTNSFSSREISENVPFITGFNTDVLGREFAKGFIYAGIDRDIANLLTFIKYSGLTNEFDTLDLVSSIYEQQNNKRAKVLEGSINVRGLNVQPNMNLRFNGQHYRVINARYNLDSEILTGKWVQLLAIKSDVK